MLHDFSKFHSRAHWWEFDSAWMMGHVAIPYNWKEFLFHRGGSFNCTSILQSGLIAGERKQRRTTDHFHASQPVWGYPDEEHPTDNLSIPRKVHYHSKWKTDNSGRRLLGQFSEHTTKDDDSGRQGLMP